MEIGIISRKQKRYLSTILMLVFVITLISSFVVVALSETYSNNETKEMTTNDSAELTQTSSFGDNSKEETIGEVSTELSSVNCAETSEETEVSLAVSSGETQKSQDETADEVKREPDEQSLITGENNIYLGTFKLTAYCGCSACNGRWGNITATGTTPVEGRTIAVDPSQIPYGSKVYIEGYGTYVAEDCGGAIKGNRIDVYMNSHSACYDFGVRYADVFIYQTTE